MTEISVRADCQDKRNKAIPRLRRRQAMDQFVQLSQRNRGLQVRILEIEANDRMNVIAAAGSAMAAALIFEFPYSII